MGYISTNRKLLSINSGNELCKGKTTMGRYSTKNSRANTINCKNLQSVFNTSTNINNNFIIVTRKLSDIYNILDRKIPDKLEKYADSKARVLKYINENNVSIFFITLVNKGIYIKIPDTINKPITYNMKKKLQDSKLAKKAQAQRNAVGTLIKETGRAVLSTTAPV